MLSGHGAVIGPPRPWLQARGLPRPRGPRRRLIASPPGGGVRGHRGTPGRAGRHRRPAGPWPTCGRKALAPLAGERDATAAKLAETLRSWLLHHGRREDVAAELFVHPQTVRYRMTRLRELYGDRLRDPDWLLLLTVALAT